MFKRLRTQVCKVRIFDSAMKHLPKVGRMQRVYIMRKTLCLTMLNVYSAEPPS